MSTDLATRFCNIIQTNIGVEIVYDDNDTPGAKVDASLPAAMIAAEMEDRASGAGHTIDLDAATVWIDYTNYRGERAIREIKPWGIEWGSTDFHPEPQWLLTALDFSKAAGRTFALKDVHGWFATKPAPSTRESAELAELSAAIRREAVNCCDSLTDAAVDTLFHIRESRLVELVGALVGSGALIPAATGGDGAHWLPIEEAPTDGEVIVLADDGDQCEVGTWDDLENDGWYRHGGFEPLGFRPTRFFRLPAIDADTVAFKAAPPAARADEAEELGADERLRWFLTILSGAGGICDAGDYPGNWLDAFCDDRPGEPVDTFNLAINRGLTGSSHDSDTDAGRVWLTDAGKAWVAALRRPTAPGAEAEPPDAPEHFPYDVQAGWLLGWKVGRSSAEAALAERTRQRDEARASHERGLDHRNDLMDRIIALQTERGALRTRAEAAEGRLATLEAAQAGAGEAQQQRYRELEARCHQAESQLADAGIRLRATVLPEPIEPAITAEEAKAAADLIVSAVRQFDENLRSALAQAATSTEGGEHV